MTEPPRQSPKMPPNVAASHWKKKTAKAIRILLSNFSDFHIWSYRINRPKSCTYLGGTWCTWCLWNEPLTSLNRPNLHCCHCKYMHVLNGNFCQASKTTFHRWSFTQMWSCSAYLPDISAIESTEPHTAAIAKMLQIWAIFNSKKEYILPIRNMLADKRIPFQCCFHLERQFPRAVLG